MKAIEYARCAIYNRASLFGIAGMATGVAIAANITPDSLPGRLALLGNSFLVTSSMMACIASAVGMPTYSSYRTASRAIEHGHANLVAATYHEDSRYCNRRGVRLALKDANLEQLLDQPNEE